MGRGHHRPGQAAPLPVAPGARAGTSGSSWDEAVEIVAAAHVHTIKAYGPDRIAGFSPIPAMSMVSHAVGSRFIELIGGAMTSFYDWYADLPVASPQVFGDQTDVPESGDWWNATYLLMWGSNVPVTRTPDAHWMAEARYKGQKVVVVSPDYADNTKFADTWLPAQPGTDGALAMAMGHVMLKEFFVDRRVPFFVDYVQRYTDLPFLVTLEEQDGAHVPGKFLTAADLGDDDRGRGVEDRARRRAHRRAGRAERVAGVPLHRGRRRAGGTSTSASVAPQLTVLGGEDGEAAEVLLPRFDALDGSGGVLRRGVPVRRVAGQAGHHGLRPDARPVRRAPRRSARHVAVGLRRRGRALHPRLAGADHLGARRAGACGSRGRWPQRRGVPGPHHDHHGGGDLPVVPRRRHLPRGAGAAHAHRVDGPQRRWLGALRRARRSAGRSPAGRRWRWRPTGSGRRGR